MDTILSPGFKPAVTAGLSARTSPTTLVSDATGTPITPKVITNNKIATKKFITEPAAITAKRLFNGLSLKLLAGFTPSSFSSSSIPAILTNPPRGSTRRAYLVLFLSF
jgi:hypothetical protein